MYLVFRNLISTTIIINKFDDPIICPFCTIIVMVHITSAHAYFHLCILRKIFFLKNVMKCHKTGKIT